MKADPDFHPIAAAWLDGTATPPEQRLLSEILHTAGNVEEYAALCRTEALLQQAGRTAAARRKSLAAMLSGKPWPQRVVSFVKSRTIRWAAAAAVLVISAWILWPSAAPEQNQTAKKNRLPLRAEDSSLAGGAVARTPREAPLPPAADGLEQKLRRCYVANFQTAAALSEAAPALAKSIDLGSDDVLTSVVRDPGDAPVHLRLPAALPAWTLLEIMALQSGTDFQLSGHNIVFLAAGKPATKEGTLTRTSALSTLRSLLAIREKDQGRDELSLYQVLTGENLAGSVEFQLASEISARYSGSPRDVRVLEMALSATENAPVRVMLTMKTVRLSPGVEIAGGIEPGAERKPGLADVFADPQFQTVMRSLSGINGVNLMTLPPVMARPNEEVKLQTEPRNSGLVAMVTVTVGEGGSCDLNCDWGIGVGSPFDGSPASAHSLSTQVLLWSGQTAGFAGFREKDGSELLAYITATIVLPDGTPLPPLEAAPASSENNLPPKIPNDAPAPGQEELPYGIPVAGKKVMVQSPYAPDKGFVDVEGLKRGTRVACPYTGKHFRVP